MISLEDLTDFEIDLINVLEYQLRDSTKSTRLAAKVSLCVLFDHVRLLVPKSKDEKDLVNWGRGETIKLKKLLNKVNEYTQAGECGTSKTVTMDRFKRYWFSFKGVPNFSKINIDKIMISGTM